MDPGRRLIESHTSKGTWAAQIACYRFFFLIQNWVGREGVNLRRGRGGRKDVQNTLCDIVNEPMKTRKPSDKDVVTETAADIISTKDGVRAIGQGTGRQPLDAERRKQILA